MCLYCMYVCTGVWVYISQYVYICTMYVYVCMCMYACMYVYMCVCIYVRTYVLTHLRIRSTYDLWASQSDMSCYPRCDSATLYSMEL